MCRVKIACIENVALLSGGQTFKDVFFIKLKIHSINMAQEILFFLSVTSWFCIIFCIFLL